MRLKTEDLLNQLSRSEEWGRSADIKIGVILAFDGVLMLTAAKHALDVMFNLSNPKYIIVACVIALVLLVWSVWKALWGITPRLFHYQERKSLLYYFDVKEMTLADYKREIGRLTEAKYKDELVHQIHALANVVSRKMVCFRDSVLLLATSLVIMGGVEIWQRLMILAKG